MNWSNWCWRWVSTFPSVLEATAEFLRMFYERSGSSSTNCQAMLPIGSAGPFQAYARLKNRVFPRASGSQIPTGAEPSRSTATGGSRAPIAGANGARLIRQSARAKVASMELSWRGAGTASSRPSARQLDAGPQVVLAPVVGAERRAEHRGHLRWRRIEPEQGADRGAHEQHGAHADGDRVAGQAKQRHLVHPAEHQRLARAHGDLPEVQREPVLAEHAAHQIVLADRGAARWSPRGRPRAAASLASARLSGRSRAIPRSSGSPPQCRTMAASATVLELTICAAPSGCPGSTSSSPVASSATRGRRRTGSQAWLSAAARPMSRAVRRRPAGKRALAAPEIEPGRTHEGAGLDRPLDARPARPRRVAFSWSATASAPRAAGRR